MPLPERLQGGADVQSQGSRQVIDQLRGVIDCGQVHQPHAFAIMLQQQFTDPQRDGGLADATRPDQGHEAPHRQLPHETADYRITPGDRGQPRRQVMLGFVQVFKRDRRELRCLLYRRDKAVAALGNVDDVAMAVLPVAKGPPQGGNVHPQVDLLDHRARPDQCDQFLFADHRARVLDQHLQDIQRPSAQPQRLIAFQNQSLIQVECVGAEAQHRVAV
ncbi:hypothetical protein D3C85_983400 [compost metagenome]